MKSNNTIWNKNFICIFIASGLFTLSQGPVNPLVSQYVQYLGANNIMMGLLTGLFYGVSFLFHPIAGPMMAKINNAKLLFCVFITGIISNLGYAFFPSLGAFFAFRLFHGILYCFAGMLCLIIAGNSLPQEKMGSGIAIYSVAGVIAQAIGPTLGIWLRDYGTATKDLLFGYKICFLFGGLTLLVALIPTAMIKLNENEKQNEGPKEAWYKSIVTAKAFPATLVLLFVIMTNGIVTSYLVNYADERGISGVNLFFLVMALSMLVTRPIAGKLVDKYGSCRTIVPSLICLFVSFLVIGFSKNLTMLIVGSVFSAIGYGSAQPGLQTICLECVPNRKRTVASNTLYIGIDLGFFLGPLFGSMIYNISNYATMYLSLTIVVALDIALFLVFLPSIKKYQKEALEN